METQTEIRERNLRELTSEDVVGELGRKEKILNGLIDDAKRFEDFIRKRYEDYIRYLPSGYKDAQGEYEHAIENSGIKLDEFYRCMKSKYGNKVLDRGNFKGNFITDRFNELYRQANEGIERCKTHAKEARHEYAQKKLLETDRIFVSRLGKRIGFLIKDMKGGRK
jgi:hypothetical protein